MADKKLEEVRILFVNMVNDEMISQLLDCLLKDRIFNRGEKDSILQENKSKNNQARALIDNVIRKGTKSSQKMIDHIQENDPFLYSELFPSSDVQPAQTDTRVQVGQASSTKGLTTEELWLSKQNDPDVYTVTKESHKNRVALLITNIEFSDPSLNRKGAEVDHKNMEATLTSLGYEVVKYTNLTGKEIDEAFIKFAQHPKLKRTDSVVVVIMSHGKLGAVLGVKWKSSDKKPDEFPINNIYTYLGPKNCPALLDKPKIIIIQACRGEGRGAVLVSDNVTELAAEEGWDEDGIRYVHKEKDFISLLSCTAETVAYRCPVNGSLLIQRFTEQCKESAHEDYVQEIFRKVMRRFEDVQFEDKGQMATTDRNTMTKHFYFFPGL